MPLCFLLLHLAGLKEACLAVSGVGVAVPSLSASTVVLSNPLLSHSLCFESNKQTSR